MALKLAEIRPGVDQRLGIFGQSGTGKTTLTRLVAEPLARTEPVVVIDTKPDYQGKKWWEYWKKDKYTVLPRAPDMRRLRPGLYIYQPKVYPEWTDPGITKILLTALKRKKSPKKNEPSCTIIIDELTDLARGTNPMPALAKVIRQGRSKHVRMIIGTQRPAAVPLIAITEASKVVAFRLISSDDRKRLAQWVHPDMLRKPGPGPYDFWFRNQLAPDEKIYLVHQGGNDDTAAA